MTDDTPADRDDSDISDGSDGSDRLPELFDDDENRAGGEGEDIDARLETSAEAGAQPGSEDGGRFSAAKSRLLAGLDRLHRFPRRALDATQRALFGSSQSYRTRIATFAMVVSAVIVALGMWLTLTSGLETSGDSSTVAEFALTILTSLWSYAAIATVVVAMLTILRDRRLADVAADKTGYSMRTVRRLAAEGRTTDGCSTVVVGPSDSILDVTNRVLDVFGVDPIDAAHDAFDYLEAQVDIDEPGPSNPDAWEPDSPEGVRDGGERSTRERFRQARLELASAVSFSELLWRFAMPALATVVALLIVVQLWVAYWVYPIIVAAGVLVGASYYQYTSWRRQRRLNTLRSPEESRPWSDIAVMVKRVETQDTTAYYGWVAGHRYVDYDAPRLAATVAWAAHAHVHDEDVPPTIQEKFARNVRQYVPNLRGYEENVEKPKIMDTLGDIVAADDTDRVPKHELADRVIQRDRDKIGRVGHDPRLVAECYDRLVPYAFVEEPITITTGDGERETMTAIRLRTSTIPPEKVAAEAEFSSRFDPSASGDYELPDVDHHHELVV